MDHLRLAHRVSMTRHASYNNWEPGANTSLLSDVAYCTAVGVLMGEDVPFFYGDDQHFT